MIVFFWFVPDPHSSRHPQFLLSNLTFLSIYLMLITTLVRWHPLNISYCLIPNFISEMLATVLP